jgi:hypothetical protein
MIWAARLLMHSKAFTRSCPGLEPQPKVTIMVALMQGPNDAQLS